MAIRIPRGFSVDRPQFKELCEGVRPNSQLVPLKAYTGLPVVRVDETHNDPVVIEPGTLVGMYADGSLVPSYVNTGQTSLSRTTATCTAFTTAQLNSFTGTLLMSGTNIPANGVVLPLGVVYKPIYSFYLETAHTNYKREHSVPILTDYVVQIPAITLDETAITPGRLVMVTDGYKYGPFVADFYTNSTLAGRYKTYTSTDSYANERVVGKCLKRLKIAESGTAGTKLSEDSDATVTAAALAEFAGLDKVQTLPGHGLSGSGTGGLPAHLMSARADASGDFWALTILIRL